MPVETVSVREVRRGGHESEPVKPNPILPVLKAIYGVLAVRVMLFLSLVGTFILAVIAIYDKTTASLWVVIAYAFLTTGPLSFLEWRGKKGG